MESVSPLNRLLQSEPPQLSDWILNPSAGRIAATVAVVVIGSAVYGATVGMWRAPLQGVYVAIKTPLLILGTLTINGLLNGILGLVLGSGLGLRQSVLVQLLSFSIAAILLAGLAPVTLFLAHQTPGPESPNAEQAHALYLLVHTGLVAFAGIIAVSHLYSLLLYLAPSAFIARITLFAWLAGNAFAGAQLSWILRPFFGNPGLNVQFLRPDPFDGTFYETVWRSLARVATPFGAAAVLIVVGICTAAILGNTIVRKHPDS